VIGALVAAVLLAVLAMVMREGVGSNKDDASAEAAKDFKINPIYAIVPVIPLFLLVIASKQVGWLPTKVFTVPVCMLIGTGIGMIVGLINRQSLGDCSKRFCRGAGDGFADVVILIAAAALFAAGMKSIGLTGALVNAMKGSQSIAMFSAAAGPFVMAAISGSGNAAALAFNEAITPHAADFGLTIVQLGAVAQIAAGLGRTMSPVAGGVIILAGIAGVNPFEVAKRTALPVLIALIVTTVAMYTLN
jgi:DcuC family C4-dicarboxylate transporter